MRYTRLLLLALFCLSTACDDTVTDTVEDPIDVGRSSPDTNVVATPIDCDELCEVIARVCTTWDDGCDRCLRVKTEVIPALSSRTMSLCTSAKTSDDCAGLKACLADKHGLVAAASGATVTVDGASTAISSMGTAWAVVGAKSDGSPSDLEIYAQAEGQAVRIKFDDLILGGVGVLAAEQYPVELEIDSEETKLKFGTVAVIRLSLEGEDPGFQIDARVQLEDGSPDVRIQASGSL